MFERNIPEIWCVLDKVLNQGQNIQISKSIQVILTISIDYIKQNGRSHIIT